MTDTNGTNNVNNQSQSTSNNICRVIEDILPDNCFTSDPEDYNESGEREISLVRLLRNFWETLEKLLKGFFWDSWETLDRLSRNSWNILDRLLETPERLSIEELLTF